MSYQWPPTVSSTQRAFVARVHRALGRAGSATQITSWYRSPARNVSVGGAPRSRHLLGLALDIVPPRVAGSLEPWARELERHGLRVLRYASHLHVDTGAPR